MSDRRNAPVFAAAAAFVLVLVFGKLIDSHSSTPTPNPSGSPKPTATSTSSPSTSPKASNTGGHPASTTPATPSALVPLTVEVTEQPGATSGVPQAISAQVLSEKRHATPLTETLFPEANGISWQLTPSPSLAAGTYQVCLQPPPGTKFVGPGIEVEQGSACMTVHLVPGSLPVVFTLARATP